MSFDAIIAAAGALLLAGTFSNRLSSRYNMPTLLMFLGIGIVVRFFGERLSQYAGIQYAWAINLFSMMAMAFILFSGGLETSLPAVRPVWRRGVVLAIAGVILTALLTGTGAYFVLGCRFPFPWCLLLGSLISSTDAAAVFAILRGRGVGLKGELQPLLELESGSNDPTATSLTFFMLAIVNGGAMPAASGFAGILREIVLDGILLGVVAGIGGGALLGALCGLLGRFSYKVKLEYEGLYFVISVGIVLATYGLAGLFHTNGFMAVYVCGIIMASRKFYYKRSITKFNNGMAWLMQVALFTVLGFLASPRELWRADLWIRGGLLSLFLMFAARPAAVFLCLARSKFTMGERILISWVGLRGAAPIMLATFPLAKGVADAGEMFHLVFVMVIVSVLFQGMTLMPLAKLLKLDCPAPEQEPVPLELEVTSGSRNREMLEFTVPPGASFAGKTLAEMHLPTGALVTMLRRDGEFHSPRGDTKILAGDGLLIMADRKVLAGIMRDFFPESKHELERF